VLEITFPRVEGYRVDPSDERLSATVVAGADRQQPRNKKRLGEAQGRDLKKQIAFGNAEFDL
jgi:hypothetical protein